MDRKPHLHLRTSRDHSTIAAFGIWIVATVPFLLLFMHACTISP